MEGNKKRLTDAEKEKGMYTICFSILAVSLVSLLLLSGISPISLFKGSITGAVVIEEKAAEKATEEVFIDYKNISFENITQELALNAILQAEKDKQEMQENGFGIVWLNDTLIEAKKYFEGEDYTTLLKDIRKIGDLEKRKKAETLLTEAQKKIGISVDYEKVLEKTKAINDRKSKAYEINDYIRASELRIKEIERTEIDMTPALEILNKAKVEFKEERYEDAIKLLAQIEPKIDEIKSENTLVMTIYKAGKETTLNFVKEHYIAIIVTLVVITIVFLLSYNRIMVKVLNRRIKDMNVEKEVLTELMKKAQNDRYSKGIIPRQTYEIKMSKYKEKMLQLKQQLPVVQARLDKLAKMKRVV